MGNLRKSLKDPNRALTVLAFRALAVFGHRNFKKFVVLARSRTGSNLLLSYLNSHPRIFVRGEIFQYLRNRDPQRVLASVFGRQPRHIRAAGFKLFYYHPLDGECGPLWHELQNMPDLHVIHLKRRNILKTLLSRKMAEMQGVWRSALTRDRVHENQSLLFSSEELRRGFVQTREWETNGERMFAAKPRLTLYYEDLAAEPQAAFRRVTDFLGLDYRPSRSKLKKQNTERIDKSLANYDELKAAFSGSEWASFFEE